MENEFQVTEGGGAVRFSVRVVPRARRSAIDGVHNGALKVRLAAPPVDGAANDGLIRLLAASLRVAARNVSIVRGQTSRTKTVEVAGVSASAVLGLAQRGARSQERGE